LRPDAGDGIPFGSKYGNGLWEWIVVAQVKEGTEGKGAIQSVLRSARTNLVTSHPHLPLPPKSVARGQTHDGWGMLDIGDSVVHIISKQARQKWFSGYIDPDMD
jgi:ribosomal silencing factor RsfS